MPFDNFVENQGSARPYFTAMFFIDQAPAGPELSSPQHMYKVLNSLLWQGPPDGKSVNSSGKYSKGVSKNRQSLSV